MTTPKALKNRRWSLAAGAGLIVLALLSGTGCSGGGSQNSNSTQQGLAPPPAPSQINSYLGTSGDIWSTKVNHTANQINGENTSLHGLQLAGAIVATFSSAGGFEDLSLTTVPHELTGQDIGFALEI